VMPSAERNFVSRWPPSSTRMASETLACRENGGAGEGAVWGSSAGGMPSSAAVAGDYGVRPG
jgi:hypothetical protein